MNSDEEKKMKWRIAMMVAELDESDEWNVENVLGG